MDALDNDTLEIVYVHYGQESTQKVKSLRVTLISTKLSIFIDSEQVPKLYSNFGPQPETSWLNERKSARR